MTLTNGLVVRSAESADLPASRLLINTAFGARAGEDYRALLSELFAVRDTIVAVDGERVVGTTKFRPFSVTVPGPATVGASGIAAVAVAPTHRRRGILRAMFTEQHRRLEQVGLPLSILTASHGAIYGRFGYGPTVRENSVTIDRRFAEFRSSAPDIGGVSLADPADVVDQLSEVYARWHSSVPATQAKPEAALALQLLDIEIGRGGGTDLYAMVHPDGYALYRYHHRGHGMDAQVVELRAVTADAHAALWRALCGLDLVQHIEAVISDNDPLPYLLTDTRLVRTVQRVDALWLRIMDIPAALTARTYATDLSTVLEVRDPFRDAGGTFAFTIRDGRAECVPTTRAAAVTLDIDVLASMYFGAYPAKVFAAANRLRSNNSELVGALDTAFATDTDACLGFGF